MSDKEVIFGDLHGVPVGQGGFATVYRVMNKRGDVFALKLADQDADEAARFSLYNEFSIQSELVFPQVVCAHRLGLHEERPYIVLDWVDGPSLFEQFSDPSEQDFISLLRQIARVLLFVHQRGWVHGDLKPENFHWSTRIADGADPSMPRLCLLDFGLARRMGDANRPRGAGTVGYCAPEFLNSLPADGRADWYSIGILLYEWIFGVRPFAADEPAVEIAGHLEDKPDFGRPRCRPAPEWACLVVARLLDKSPDDRAEDENSLLAWLSEYIPDLEPATLLNNQLPWHLRSESVCLRPYEIELLESLRSELESGNPALWAIDSHGFVSDTWIRRAEGLCSILGYEVLVEHDGPFLVFLREQSSTPGCDPRIHIRCEGRLTTSWPDSGPPPRRALSLLPWDREEVRTFLSGIVGDDVAEAWTDTILAASCGLPAATSELTRHLISENAISVDVDGWELDEDAVYAWRDRHASEYIAATFGTLDGAELALCQWIALGEGRGARAVVAKVWGDESDELGPVLSRLVARGLIIEDLQSSGSSFELRLRLTGHDVVLRAMMTEDDIRRKSRSLAEVIGGIGSDPDPVRSEILGHAYARAEVWDKSADECLRTAKFAIKSEDRDRAMHYIAMAQNSAGQIVEAKTRSHWIGQARMVEGDLQKAVGQLDAARQIYRELLVICRANGDRRLLAETLHDLGDLYYTTRQYYKGIRTERQSWKIWEELGDRGQASRSLNSLGNLHRLAGDFRRASEFYQQAHDIQMELGLEQFAATNLNNIGIIHWLEYHFVEAESFFRRALEIQERLKVPVEIARVLNNLGAISFVQGHLDESEQYFARAASLNATAGAQSEALYNQRNLVEVALERGDLRTAITLGQQVHQACRDIGDVSTMAEVGALLADAFLQVGDHRSASRFHAETLQTSASLKNDELRAYLMLLQAARLHRFNRDSGAAEILATLSATEPRLTTRYQQLDVMVLQMKLAVSGNDSTAKKQRLESGHIEAAAIGAPHKAAQLDQSRLEAGECDDISQEIAERVEEFLANRPRWHWAPKYWIWQAQQTMNAGDLSKASEIVTSIISQARRDGCLENLWRTLVLQGQISHAQADYEPAMRALDEAANLLKIVLSTVDDEKERASYLECRETTTLEQIRDRIAELIA